MCNLASFDDLWTDQAMSGGHASLVARARGCGVDDLAQVSAVRQPRLHPTAWPDSPARSQTQAVTVHIYRPARSAMQAGLANSKGWVLEFEPQEAPFIEPLMGWTGTRDTRQQVRLTFPTMESAVAFAEMQGWTYSVTQPHEPRLRPKSYADNFRSDHPCHAAGPSGARSGRSSSEAEKGAEPAVKRSVLHESGSTQVSEDTATLDRVDEASLESFPASDPPSWIGTTLK